jgi:MFS family permease
MEELAIPTKDGRVPLTPPKLADISRTQWKSGIAAWLGWAFDGLELHLYTLVAVPFVAALLQTAPSDRDVRSKVAWIQAAFLLGWALGGAFFGAIGDRLGRSRALSLTILTYALFTGLSFFAQTWWQLFIFRFVAALGIGGEWAVGASLLTETWPKRWRPWIAGVLQMGAILGILAACGAVEIISTVANAWHASRFERFVFLVGVIPALLVFWVRKHVPEPEEWKNAKSKSTRTPGVADLFHEKTRRTTMLTLIVCALTLTGWWSFIFWHPQYLRSLPEVAAWPPLKQQQLVTRLFFLVNGVSILGIFFSSWLASRFGYRRSILAMCLAFCVSFAITFGVPRNYDSLMVWLPVIGFCSGVFGLFTMYLPPLFPTLLRTTGAGFCYNIGRLAAAVGTVVFGVLSVQVDYRVTLLGTGFLFLAAAVFAWFLPELSREEGGTR